MTDNMKFYKNRKRNDPEQYKPYVPQYKVLGVEPSEYKSAVVPTNTKIAQPEEGTDRARKIGMRQEYASSVPSPVGKGPIPNIGNNVEHTWSSVDGDIIDDLLDPNHPMVDNNNFITSEALDLSSKKAEAGQQLALDDLFSILHDLEDSAYLLIVDGVPICSGPKVEIEEQARALVFGDHEICDGAPIPSDDIVIIKRVPVKVGLFLE